MRERPFSEQPLWIGRDGARARPICRSADYDAALVHYPADVRHPVHEHGRAQLTFLLCGGLVDDWEGRESMPSGPRHGFRPEGARHSCRFGPSGALILSVNFRSGALRPRIPPLWRPSGARLAELYGLLFGQHAPAGQILDDLIAAAGESGQCGTPAGISGAPRWLRVAVEELVDDPTAEIEAIASRAGVHRVHLSRAFQKHLGISPSKFRLHCKGALALRHMIEGHEAPGMAAAAAGFADQSHWTRASRAVSGLTPGALRLLLAS